MTQNLEEDLFKKYIKLEEKEDNKDNKDSNYSSLFLDIGLISVFFIFGFLCKSLGSIDLKNTKIDPNVIFVADLFYSFGLFIILLSISYLSTVFFNLAFSSSNKYVFTSSTKDNENLEKEKINLKNYFLTLDGLEYLLNYKEKDKINYKSRNIYNELIKDSININKMNFKKNNNNLIEISND